MKYSFKNKISYYIYEIIFISLVLITISISYISTYSKQTTNECNLLTGQCEQTLEEVNVNKVSEN